MVNHTLVDALQDRDDKKAYDLSKEIREKSDLSDEFYEYFEEFLGLLSSKSSFVRTRGFMLCCRQAKWDMKGKIEESLPRMLILLHDIKPTVVRQCLSALADVVEFKPELKEIIAKELDNIDLTNYKDSMVPLIIKDISVLRQKIAGK